MTPAFPKGLGIITTEFLTTTNQGKEMISNTQATVAAKQPISVEVEEGKKYFWCRCGKSKKQPFCDGAHAGSDFTPMVYTAEKTGTLWFCACKQTNKEPLCDGSHTKL